MKTLKKFRELFVDSLTDFQKENYQVSEVVDFCFYITGEDIISKPVVTELVFLSQGQAFKNIKFYIYTPKEWNKPTIKVFISF